MAYVILRLFGRLRPLEYVIILGMGLSLMWQLLLIIPYTAIYPREMVDSPATDNRNRLSLLVYNVLSENRDVQALLNLIEEHNPDAILLSEPNQWWFEQLEILEKQYPFTVSQPQENQYGMILYSRFELSNPEIRFLVEPGIPSVRVQIRLLSDEIITLYGVHPRPPGLKPKSNEVHNTRYDTEDQEDGEREDTDKRDAELMIVAKEIGEIKDEPVIVAGDFNDVAWSHTTHLFQRIWGLLDPRVGRGLFTTFDTRSRLMRYPLDHVFATKHFLLVDLKRLPDIGSDHFPFLVVLDYLPNVSQGNDEPQPESGDKNEANEAIEKVKSND